MSVIRRLSSFTYLNITQFLGALNDNIYKLLIVFFFIQIQGIEHSAIILASTGATFVLPFLLFSAWSGTLADRCSKRNIIVLTKVMELGIMIAGLAAFYTHSIWGSYCILFLLAAQSALFGPSKYGIVPELVAQEKISRSNGLMTSFTFLAIILGTFSASFLLDISDRDFIFASTFCIGIAIIGMLASFCIEYTPPSGSSKPFDPFFLREIYSSLRQAATQPSLLMAIFGSAYFLFLGAFVQLNMIPFAVQSLGLTDVQGGYLFLLTAIGIGIGALIAGKLSGKIVELGIVPLAGIGVTLSSYFLDYFSDSLFAVVPLVVILGLFGGMYQIPLDSYIQIASPNQSRGQMVAATNFLSFFGVLCASFLIYLIFEVFEFNADKGFTVIGSLNLALVAVISYQYFDYLSRLIGMLLSWIHFKVSYKGIDFLPDTPAIYVVPHTAWNDTLLMLGAQKRRLRFFVEEHQISHGWTKSFYRLLRIVLIPEIEPQKQSQAALYAIKSALEKGISVCIFVHPNELTHAVEKIKQLYTIQELLEGSHYPIIPVNIDKGEKEPKPLFNRLCSKIRVPATVSFGDEAFDPSPNQEGDLQPSQVTENSEMIQNSSS